jgi:hypothetical protein
MAAFVIPTAAKTREFLGMLFGDDLKVVDGKPVSLPTSFVATFVDDSDKLVGVCAADLSFAAFAGTAMSMLPPGVAKEAIAAKQLSDVMKGNLGEVMNILSRLFMSDTSPHLRFLAVHGPGEQNKLADSLSGANRSNFSITIPRYGTGQVSFLVT